MGKGNLSNPKVDETEGFQCLGHSNWTIFSPLSHFCFKIFTSFSPSYWEANFYYPKRDPATWDLLFCPKSINNSSNKCFPAYRRWEEIQTSVQKLFRLLMSHSWRIVLQKCCENQIQFDVIGPQPQPRRRLAAFGQRIS